MKLKFVIMLLILLIGCKSNVTIEEVNVNIDDVITSEELEDQGVTIEEEDAVVEIIEEVVEEEPDEEPEEEPEEVPEEEEATVIPEVENFIIDAECSGRITSAGKLTSEVNNVRINMAKEGAALNPIGTTYLPDTGWFSATEDDFEKGTYEYELEIILLDITNHVLKNGELEILPCAFVLSSVPEDEEEDVVRDIKIEITFSGDMDKDSVDAAINAEFSYSTSWSDNTLKITPSEDLDYDVEYTVTIDTDATDDDGNNMDEIFSLTFTIMDVPPPVIDDIDFDQQHDEEEDDPHIWDISIGYDDPDDNDPVNFLWEVDCGYFYVDSDEGQDYEAEEADEVEWRYNSTTDDCDSADITLTLTNALDAELIETINVEDYI